MVNVRDLLNAGIKWYQLVYLSIKFLIFFNSDFCEYELLQVGFLKYWPNMCAEV